jgi:hypothetical protein
MSLSSSLNSRNALDNPDRSAPRASYNVPGTATPPGGMTTSVRQQQQHAPAGHGSVIAGSNSGILVSSAHGAHGYGNAPPQQRRLYHDERLQPDEGDLIERLIMSRTRLEQQGALRKYFFTA